MERITGLVKELKENEVFVSGSNLSGRHEKGAAKTAMKWGARYGQGEGLAGRAYAIPTVNASITGKLSIAKIASYVDTFIAFAEAHKELQFLVTAIGTGLAGWRTEDIAPLFRKARDLENVYLPKEFWFHCK